MVISDLLLIIIWYKSYYDTHFYVQKHRNITNKEAYNYYIHTIHSYIT